MPGTHALLSASGAKRWMECPPSARLEESLPSSTSSFAEEGTFAHSMAELILRYNNGEITKKTFTTRLNKLKANEFYNQELEDYITDYTQQVWEIFNEAKATCPDAQALFEQRLDFSEYVPDGFGTGDVVIIADDLIQVIDLKYGKGIGVSAINNPQLRLYAIGAYLEHSLLYDIQRVKMTIVQPRLENTSTEEMTVSDLLDWGENEVKPRAALAIAGEGEMKVGEHCRFCRARATCRARAENNLDLAKLDFQPGELLTDEEIGEVLERAEELASWVKDIKEYAFDQILNHGQHYEGWKLVEGRSNRKYADAKAIEKRLIDSGYSTDQFFTLVGVTEMTKLTGKKKFEELLGDLVVKPEGKPTLVPETDKRPPFHNAATAKKDFIEGYEECLETMKILESLPPERPLEHYLESMAEKYSAQAITAAYNTLKGE